MEFSQLQLPEFICRALESKGIKQCTEIQEKAIPLIQEGKDVIGKSKTGSGKTFAYAIPCVQKADTETGDTQIMVVCPTRELAAQVTEQMRFLNTFREGCKVVPLFGGINMARQITSLKKNAEIIVGTPGRIVDHIKRRTIKLDSLKTLVLDEADEMLNMGFKDEMETIIKHCPESRQTVMFSATMPEAAIAISRNYMNSPCLVEIDDLVTRSVAQYYVRVGLKNKDAAIKSMIKKLKPVHSIVFCNTKRMVDKLSASLVSVGVNVTAIHGDMRQNERKAAMDGLKSGNARILIATDVAARGIDIEGVDIVFNYDVPQTPEYYTHRIGRTGRVDKKGLAFTLINTDWGMQSLQKILDVTNNRVELYELSESLSPKENNFDKEQRKRKRAEEKKQKIEHEKPYYLQKSGSLSDIREFIDSSNAAPKNKGKKSDYARKTDKNTKGKSQKKAKPRDNMPKYGEKSRNKGYNSNKNGSNKRKFGKERGKY